MGPSHGSIERWVSSQCHDRLAGLKRWAKEACMLGRYQAGDAHMEPIMAKQKKTNTKPISQDTKARARPTKEVATPKTKLGRLEGMLRRADGATIAKALDWQMHSIEFG